jgi:hypothetical protein
LKRVRRKWRVGGRERGGWREGSGGRRGEIKEDGKDYKKNFPYN